MLATFQKISEEQEKSKTLLAAKVELETKTAALESKMSAEQSAHQEQVEQSQQDIGTLKQEVSKLELEQVGLKKKEQEVAGLYLKLSQAQEETTTVLQTKVELTAQVSTLQRQLNVDREARDKDISRGVLIAQTKQEQAEDELQALKEQFKALKIERGDAGEMFRQGFSAMFGGN